MLKVSNNLLRVLIILLNTTLLRYLIPLYNVFPIQGFTMSSKKELWSHVKDHLVKLFIFFVDKLVKYKNIRDWSIPYFHLFLIGSLFSSFFVLYSITSFIASLFLLPIAKHCPPHMYHFFITFSFHYYSSFSHSFLSSTFLKYLLYNLWSNYGFSIFA